MNSAMKGQATGAIVAVVVVAIMVILGGLVYGYVRDSMTQSMSDLNSAQFNATVTTIDNNAYAGLSLMSVAIIVTAAVAIISIVLMLRSAG